jgi:hypothetical protein
MASMTPKSVRARSAGKKVRPPGRFRLDPLPTQRATSAIAQLCEHLTDTQTRYPGTNLILRYEIKAGP